ncbi:MAG: hypothetical protein WCP32_18660, partial [Bacteroidota bacterium]
NGYNSTWSITYNNLYQTTTSTGTSQYGITIGSGQTSCVATIDHNYIGGSSISAGGTWTNSAASTIYPLYITSHSTSSTSTITNNTIQNFNQTNATTSALTFIGLNISGAGLHSNISGNVISSVTQPNTTSTSSKVGGILNGCSTAGSIIQSNIVHDLSTLSRLTGDVTSTTAASNLFTAYGIISNTAAANQTISQNTIYNIGASNTGAYNTGVVGIGIDVTGSTGTVSRNRIYGLTNTCTGTTQGIAGIRVYMGSWTYANNQISITNSPNTNFCRVFGVMENGASNNWYYNSVYVGGTTSGTAHSGAFADYYAGTRTVNLRNNIFYNERSGGTGRQYCIYMSATPSTFTTNYNLFVPVADATLGYSAAADKTFATWKALGGGTYDPNSVSDISSNVASATLFTATSTGKLTINSGSIIANIGVTGTGISDDYDGKPRSTSTPDIGSDEFTAATTWTGTISSDWNVLINWSAGVPGVSADITIPGSLTNYPTISFAVSCKSMIIQSGGSILGNQYLTLSGSSVFQRSIPSDNAWHFLSSPVSSQNICDGTFAPLAGDFNSTNGATYDFFKWSEPTAITSLPWINLKLATTWAPNLTDFGGDPPHFVPTTGYLVAYSDGFTGPPTKSFAGDLNTGDKTVTLTKDGNTWNLIGNPFPSAINWDAVTDKSNLDNGYYYIYNSGKIGGEGYESYLTGLIPAMQGFFVTAKTSGAGTIGIPNAARTHGGTWVKNAESNPLNQIKLKLSHDTYFDETSIMFNENGSLNKGWYDASKLFSMNVEVPQVYTMKDNGRICINSLPAINDPMTVPVGMFIPSDGNYSIDLSGLETFSSRPGIILEDLKTNTTQNMVQTPVYSFSASKTDDPKRFLLHFALAIGINDKTASQPFHVFASDNSLVIVDNTGNNKGEVSIYNMMGQLILHQP